ncbi:MAG TPA: SRPBCC family protein [Caldimonas sp.]|nr:SRPBCC family protein [Caldimonas sp.]
MTTPFSSSVSSPQRDLFRDASPTPLRRLALFLGVTIALVGGGLLVAEGASAAYDEAVGQTVTVTEKVDVAATPAKTWDRIQDFMAWPAWHPAFASTQLVKGDGNAKGSIRLLTAKDGAQFTEELLTHDAQTRVVEYRILNSPAPVTGYVSTLQVKEAKAGSSVVWSSSFKVKPGTSDDDAKKAIAGIYRLGLDNLASVVR